MRDVSNRRLQYIDILLLSCVEHTRARSNMYDLRILRGTCLFLLDVLQPFAPRFLCVASDTEGL